ncbi:MAG: hypothetical protein J7577_13365 [Sphingobacteriaceae bacterium]|nr:hypothetical protein [Sphingobacteriaceae bacterium]
MAFLRKKEDSLINMIHAAANLNDDQKKEMITSIKYKAKLRQDRYRKPVKVFINVITDFKNNNLAKRLING